MLESCFSTEFLVMHSHAHVINKMILCHNIKVPMIVYMKKRMYAIL